MNRILIGGIVAIAALASGLSAMAKDVEACFTVNPQMHCESCETKIKSNLRFEKGVKKIETSIPEQKVTITYNPDKTTPEKIEKAFSKIGYEAQLVNEEQGE